MMKMCSFALHHITITSQINLFPKTRLFLSIQGTWQLSSHRCPIKGIFCIWTLCVPTLTYRQDLAHCKDMGLTLSHVVFESIPRCPELLSSTMQLIIINHH
jgi:hypothetical protein